MDDSMVCLARGAADTHRKRRMRLAVTDLEGEHGLRLAGELDLSSAARLTDALEPLLRQGGRIVLEISRLTFMDSTGLQVLIRSSLTLGERGTIVLRDPGNLVRSI